MVRNDRANLTMHVIRKVLSLSAIAGLFATSGFPSAERVICVGDDGHISVEIAVGGACADAPGNEQRSKGPTDQSIRTDATSHCGSCEDLPIGNDTVSVFTVRETPSKIGPLQAPVLLVAPAISKCAQSVQRAAAFAVLIDRAPSTLLLRSVSLQL
jgi:hypothetical protein